LGSHEGDFLAFFRQASEQYFTSSQFFAHARRQVMVRWHTTQILLGSACLLPLKSLLIDALLPKLLSFY